MRFRFFRLFMVLMACAGTTLKIFRNKFLGHDGYLQRTKRHPLVSARERMGSCDGLLGERVRELVIIGAYISDPISNQREPSIPTAAIAVESRERWTGAGEPRRSLSQGPDSLTPAFFKGKPNLEELFAYPLLDCFERVRLSLVWLGSCPP